MAKSNQFWMRTTNFSSHPSFLKFVYKLLLVVVVVADIVVVVVVADVVSVVLAVVDVFVSFSDFGFFSSNWPQICFEKNIFFSIQQVPFLSDNFLKAKKHLNFFNQLLKSKQIFFRSIQFDWGLKWDLGAKTFSRTSNCRSALISKQFKYLPWPFDPNFTSQWTT